MNPEPPSELGAIHLTFRLIAVLVLIPTSYYLIVCLPFTLLPVGDRIELPIMASLAWAAVALWYVYGKLHLVHQSLFPNILMGATVGASFGLSVGFLGSIFLLPIPDIAPLIGIVIVAPVCFLLGALGGGMGWLLRRL